MATVLGEPTLGLLSGTLFKNRLINGSFNIAQRGTTLGVSTTGTTSNGSAVVTGIPATASVRTGMAVYSAGGQVPTGRTVLSVDSATQVTLSDGTSVLAGTDQAIVFAPADNAYTLDRWRLLTENEAGAIINQESTTIPTGYTRAARMAVSNPNGKFGLWQVIEGVNCRDLRGKTVTVSGQVRIDAAETITDVRVGIVEFTGTLDSVSGDPISTWGAALTNPTLAASYAFLNTPAALTLSAGGYVNFSASAAVGATMNNMAVFVWCDDRTTTAGHFLYVANVQIEVSEAATPFEIRDINTETVMCRRYAYSNQGSGQRYGVGFCTSTTRARIEWVPWVPMRTTPTLTVGLATLFVLLKNDGNVQAVTVMAINVANSQFVEYVVDVAANLVAGDGTILTSNAASQLLLDAEL